jgi:hypothetical protein
MMSTNSVANSTLAADGSRNPTARGDVEQRSKEAPPPLGFVTPPPSKLISKYHTLTNLDFLRVKRHRSNSYESSAFPPIVLSPILLPVLSNPNALQADDSLSAKVELSSNPKTTFILATPDEVSIEMQHPAIKRPRAVYMATNDSTRADSPVYSNNEVLENRHGSMSGMFLPIHGSDPEKGLSREEGRAMTGKYRLKLKPRKRTVSSDLFK